MTAKLFLLSISLGFLLIFLKIDGDIVISLLWTIAFLICVAVAILFFKNVRTSLLGKIILTTSLAMTFWGLFTVYSIGKSFSELNADTITYINNKLNQYYDKNGHFPNTKSSSDLADSIGINTNYFPIDTYWYQLNKDKKYFKIGKVENSKTIRIYDSRK